MRHFRAMGVAVEEGEERDEGRAGPEGEAHGKYQEQAEQKDGEENAGFHHRKIPACRTHETAESHDANETGWHRPDSPAAKLRCPEPHGNHGQQMVEAVKGMIEPVHEAVGVTRPGVGVGEGGNNEEQGEQVPFHARDYTGKHELQKTKIFPPEFCFRA